MKRLNFFEKVIFVINSVVATLLLLSYILPYIAPKRFAIVSVLSLAVPLLIIINIVFVIYWVLRLKKQVFLSVIILCIGYNYVFSLYKFSSSKQKKDSENISVMNYNVRLFNLFKWIENDSIPQKINGFIAAENPDVLSLQEYHFNENIDLKNYYKHEVVSGKKVKSGQAIFSKFPIINSGSIEFHNTSNNAIFVDIVKQKDTIRVYNVHLQSLHIDTDIEQLKNETSENLIRRVSKTFEAQQIQTELFMNHKRHCKYKIIICGDFNNTAYSYVYNTIKDDFNDAFVEAGHGFGSTFDFEFFPIRIDFILTDNSFQTNNFETYDIKLSDHYPIMAEVKLN